MQEQAKVKEKFQKALDAIKTLKNEVSELKAGYNVPIAIVGLACRYPNGVDSLERFKELLALGVNTVSNIPRDRWDIKKYFDENGGIGKMNVKKGSFLRNIDQFDNMFFDIPPIEAEHMDPQLRIFLMVTHEAIENAGLSLDRLKNSNTGVFVGSTGADYALRNFYSNDASQIDTYAMTGISDYSRAGRLAYFYDLKGPSATVNTACSSSLTAFHLACQSLRTREADMAITGGASLILSPHSFIALSQMNALSKDGISKTFDQNANGYSRGEAVGVVILKRLEDAVRDKDNILSVIRGSAINQDGRSNGFTAPNGASQENLIKRALNNAGLKPDDIDYLETHGTGTILGDPIELEAIRNVFAESKTRTTPLYVGAVKTNVGHTEAAAGISGIIKATAALQEKKIYKHLHLETLNPFFDWENTPIKVSTKLTDWEKEKGIRRAGVSSFGVSGTNVHVILEESPELNEEKDGSFSRSSNVLTLSAINKEALKNYAEKYIRFLEDSDEKIENVCSNAIYKRTHFNERLSVSGTKEEIINKLKAISNDNADAFIRTVQKELKHKVVFVFPGQGSQWIGMGRELYKEEEVFRNKIDECEEKFKKYVDWSLVEELNKDEKNNQFHRIDIIQPTLFALNIAIAELWKSWGVEPDSVIGHSMGEVAASYVAGALSLNDAANIICSRSKLMLKLSGKGAMAVVGCNIEETTSLISDYKDVIDIAVSNSPKSTVISGDTAAIEKVIREIEQKDIFCRKVNVDVASHSQQVDGLKEDLLVQLESIQPQKTNISMFSTVLAEKASGDNLNAEYWINNLRNPVRFYDTINKMRNEGNNIFIECSPHPVLETAIEQIVEESDEKGFVLSSFHKDMNDQTDMLQSLGLLHGLGYSVDWKIIYPNANRFVQLPTYPWQLKPFWIEASENEFTSATPKLPITKSKENIQGAENSRNDAVLEKVRSIKNMEERVIFVKEYLLKMICNISGRMADQLDENLTFKMLGIDSLILMKIRMTLEKEFNQKFPVKIFWTNSTIDKLAKLVLSELNQEPVAEVEVTERINPWLDIPKPNKNAAIKLFCFHPAGGTSSMYHEWVDKINPDVELIAIEFPGRGERINEEVYEDKAKLVEDLTPVIAQYADRPFMFFGHCMGAFILFEVTRKLRKEFNIQPNMITISASPHPTDFEVKYKFHLMSDLELAGLFPELDRSNFNDDEYYNLVLRIMRSDIQLGKLYEFLDKDVPPLDIPIVSVGPVDDELADLEFFKIWEKETTDSFELITCSGGHNYIYKQTDMLTELVNNQIKKYIIPVDTMQ
jgi:acyl transferase domain-containing protein/surfactin synthase thioesterase subunit